MCTCMHVHVRACVRTLDPRKGGIEAHPQEKDRECAGRQKQPVGAHLYEQEHLYECACVCVCVCINLCAYIYVRCVYVHAPVCMYVHAPVCMCMHLYVCMYVCAHLDEREHRVDRVNVV